MKTRKKNRPVTIILIQLLVLALSFLTFISVHAELYPWQSVEMSKSSKPAATVITSLKSSSSGKFTVKWKAKKNVSGYQIRYSTNSYFSGMKKISVKAGKISYTVNGVTPGTKYYVSIRTFKKANGEYYYSKWSNKKSVTVKGGSSNNYAWVKRLIKGKWYGVSSRNQNHYYYFTDDYRYLYEESTNTLISKSRITGIIKVGDDYAVLIDAGANYKWNGYRFHISNGTVTDLWAMTNVYNTATYSGGSSLRR